MPKIKRKRERDGIAKGMEPLQNQDQKGMENHHLQKLIVLNQRNRLEEGQRRMTNK